MVKKIAIATIFSLILATSLLSVSAMAAPLVELIKPISDIKTVNKNIIISGWADMDTIIEIKVFSREVENIDGKDVYKWVEFKKEGQDNKVVVGPTGFFAKEIELKRGLNKVVIDATSPSGEKQVIEGEVTLATKEEVRKSVENLLNINFLDIIKKIIQ